MVEPKREPKFAEYFQVYIWQLPVRFFHWTTPPAFSSFP